MKLKRLAISRLPGITQPFEIEMAGVGFHVVFGPNGIGKSSLCRAVEGLYWADRGPSQRTSVVGEFELNGNAWWAEREGSRVRWQRDGENTAPPSLPASHNHRYFFLRLRDLIDPSPDGTHDIASEIRRQMSGGFDLNEIASDNFSGVSNQRIRRERSEFTKASEAVQDAEGQQVNLQRRADQIGTLREKLGSAEASARRLVAVDRALGHAGRLEEHARVLGEMAALPVGLARLSGDEVEQIERLQGQINSLNERVRSVERQRDDARDAKRDARLDGSLDESALAIWRENTNELSRVDIALEAAASDRSAARNALAAALSALGGGSIVEDALDLPQHAQLFEFLRAAEGHRTRVNAIRERLRLLAHVDAPEDNQRELEIFRSAAEALRSWLRAPEPESFSDRFRARRLWLLLALIIAIAGAGLAILVDPMFVVLLAAGLGIAVPVCILGNPAASSGARVGSRNAFVKLSVEEPEAWEVPSVEARLRSMEGEIAELNSGMQRARDRGVERQSLESVLAGLSETEVTLNDRRRSLSESLNLDPIPADAELVDFARALDQLRTARIEDARLAGKVEELEKRQMALLSNLADVLERHGEKRPEDAKSATAYLDNLATRSARSVQAMSDEQRANAQLEQFSLDRGVALGEIEKIYEKVSLENGDLPGLTALLTSLPHYLELKSSAMRLDAQIELDQDALSKAGETALAENDRLALEALQSQLTKSAEDMVSLHDEIAEINAQVNEAKRGTNIQDLIADREQSRTKLLDCRDEALFAKAGKFLIDAVEAEFEQTQMPRVFERARDHFSAFTHYNYELRLGREADAPRLFAIDLRSGEGRGLDELSDGTRAQLLLAARVAFAEEVEQGSALPLFLDEALDQSDPARFEAMVRSLGQIAHDQERQIFYLTSDPADVERIRRALAEESHDITSTIDLGLIRANAASVGDLTSLYVMPRPTVPDPDGLSAEEYGVELGVSAFQPELGHAEQHFFYLLSDDLDRLHDFLANGIERVGQWKAVSDTPLAKRLGSGSISPQQITARSDLLEVFCELWKQGRGSPVDRDALEASGAISARYFDDVVAMSEEQCRDPERLLAVLRTSKDPRLNRFRRASADDLEQYLRDHAFLDDQPVLTEPEVRLLALASPAATKLPDGVASSFLNRWWTLAWRVTEQLQVRQE